jgi:hypothetical protein
MFLEGEGILFETAHRPARGLDPGPSTTNPNYQSIQWKLWNVLTRSIAFFKKLGSLVMGM